MFCLVVIFMELLVALISTPRAALAKYLQMSAGAVFHFRSWEDVVS